MSTQSTGADCIFCGIVAGTIPGTKVYEDERTFAFMDIAPGTEGHLLVVPKAHSADLLEIPAEDLTAVALTGQRMAHRVMEVLEPDGVNLLNSCGAAAWQTVFHFHLHVIPRYAGKDTLELPWTPTPGDPEAIAAVGEKLALR